MNSCSTYLFGSNMREESSQYSDLDILVVSDSINEVDVNNFDLPLDITRKNLPIDYSLYSTYRLREMYETGHLFAWHLYIESSYLNGDFDRLANFGEPKPYTDFDDDTVPLLKLLAGIKDNILESKLNLIYEAGLSYLCARNIAISASYFSDRGLSFSINAPFMVSANRDYFPLNLEQYTCLRQARLASTRGFPAPELTFEELYIFVEKIYEWALITINHVRKSK